MFLQYVSDDEMVIDCPVNLLVATLHAFANTLEFCDMLTWLMLCFLQRERLVSIDSGWVHFPFHWIQVRWLSDFCRRPSVIVPTRSNNSDCLAHYK